MLQPSRYASAVEDMEELVGEMLRLRQEDLDWLTVADEVVALDAKEAVYLSANRTGALLWDALTKGTTREELARTLVDAFGIDEATALGDVDVFLGQMEERGLLER